MGSRAELRQGRGDERTQRWHSRLEEQQLAPQGVDDHEGGLQGRPHGALRRQVVHKHVGERVQEGVDDGPALLQVDQQVVRLRDEGVVDFRDHLQGGNLGESLQEAMSTLTVSACH